MEVKLLHGQPIIALFRKVSPDLYNRLSRKRLPFSWRNVQVSRDIHRMRSFEATCGLILADLHMATCTRAEEDWMADRGYKPAL